jgi:hypothetical protein
VLCYDPSKCITDKIIKKVLIRFNTNIYFLFNKEGENFSKCCQFLERDREKSYEDDIEKESVCNLCFAVIVYIHNYRHLFYYC